MFYWTSVIVRNALRLTACSAAIAATLFSGRDAGATPVVQAVRTAAPVIDGVLDEEVWRAGRPVTQFTQNVPNDGEAATEATRVTVVYDDEALYIAAEMDDSAPVTERLGRRDADLDVGYEDHARRLDGGTAHPSVATAFSAAPRTAVASELRQTDPSQE
jgi:hypothetical protein